VIEPSNYPVSSLISFYMSVNCVYTAFLLCKDTWGEKSGEVGGNEAPDGNR